MKKIRKCAIMMAVMLGVLQLNMVAWAAEDEIPVVEQQDVELAFLWTKRSLSCVVRRS